MKNKSGIILATVMIMCTFTACAKDESSSSQKSSSSSQEAVEAYSDRIQEPIDKGSNLVGTTDEMQSVDFWIDNCKNADEVIMSSGEILALNDKINSTEGTNCIDLYSYPEKLSADELNDLLNTYSLPTEARYDQYGNIASYYEVEQNCNKYSVAQTNDVQFGYISNECELYSFPTTEPSYSAVGDYAFNMFAETTQKVWDKVAVLHTSADGEFVFVQSDSYLGWVESENVCIVSGRDVWTQYDEQDFLTVTDKELILDNNPFNEYTSDKNMSMGTMLPIAEDKPDTVDNVGTISSYVVLLPGRTADGGFEEIQARVNYSSDICEGYLPYTKANLFTQAFKFLGERYGWSNSIGSHDCTGFIKDVYSSFGIRLPRNTDNMDLTPCVHNDVSGKSDEEKAKLFAKSNEGAIMISDGHAMMYLGTVDSKPYVIQDFSRFTADGTEYNAMCVAVTDLDLTLSGGETYMSIVNGITEIKK